MADERAKPDSNRKGGGVVGGYSSSDAIGAADPTIIMLRLDPTTGRLLVDSNAGGTAYTEDVATPAAQVGSATMVERDDALSAVTPVEGDWIGLRGTAEGALWTQDFNSDALLSDTNAMVVDLAAIEVLLGTIDADTGAIKTAVEILDNAIDGNYLNTNMNIAGTDVSANAGVLTAQTQRVTIATDDEVNNLLGTIDADTGAIKTAVELIDNAIAGSEMQVDVVAALPAGTNVLGKMRLVTATGDEITEDTDNSMQVTIVADDVGIGGGTAYTEDVATANPIVGTATLMERDDALAAVTPIEGDWIGLRGSAEGALWVQDFNSDAILADTAAMVVDLAAIEVLLGTIDTDTGAMVTDLAAIEALLITIDSDTNTIQGDTTSIQTAVELIDDAIYVDDADWTDNTSKHMLVGGIYQSAPHTVTDGDVSPFQLTANGYLISALSPVDNAVLDAMVVDLAAIEVLLGTIDSDTNTIQGDTTAIKTAVELLDNAVDGSYLNTNMNIAGTDVAANAGVLTAQTQRVTIATDDEVNNLLGTIDADTGAMVTDLAAIEVLLGTIDTDTGAMVTDLAAIEALLITIDSDTNTIQGDTTAIQSAVEAMDGAIIGPGEPTIDSYTQVAINLGAAANQVLVSSAASKQIWVYAVAYTCSVAGTVSFQDEDDVAVSGIMDHAANSGLAMGPSGNFAMPIWKLGTDKDLEVDVVTAAIDGFISYAIVSV